MKLINISQMPDRALTSILDKEKSGEQFLKLRVKIPLTKIAICRPDGTPPTRTSSENKLVIYEDMKLPSLTDYFDLSKWQEWWSVGYSGWSLEFDKCGIFIEQYSNTQTHMYLVIPEQQSVLLDLTFNDGNSATIQQIPKKDSKLSVLVDIKQEL